MSENLQIFCLPSHEVPCLVRAFLRCLFWTICELYMVGHHIVEVAYWACCCLIWSHDNPVSRHSLSPSSCSCEKNLKNMKYAWELFRDFQSCRHFLSGWVHFFLCVSMMCHEGALPSSSSRGPGPLKTDLYRNQCFLFQRVTIVTTVNFVCFDCKRCQTYKQVALWVKPPCWVSLP